MKKIGILGGGQLGRMFLQNAFNYPYEFWVLDPSENAPAKNLCHHFIQGDFNDYQAVVDFAENVEILTIEIEHVNIEALVYLEKQGKEVVPSSNTLKIIQDKGLQKEFYVRHNIPTSRFYLIDNDIDIDETIDFPLVQKTRTGGYDGKGVKVAHSKEELMKNTPSVIENRVEIEKELAVIVVQSEKETKTFPTVEMVFDPQLNLVDELFSPANISGLVDKKAQEIALKVARAFEGKGIFAVELFLSRNGEIWVNETAPRVHNSGHGTIEGNYSSQFDAMLRMLVDAPLGDHDSREMATMINLIGGERDEMNIRVLNQILEEEKCYFHWYGKQDNRKGRKMGHITLLGERTEKRIQQIKRIKQQLKELL